MSKRFRAPAFVERCSVGQGNILSARRQLLMWLRRCMQSMAALSLPFRLPGALSVRVLFLLDCYAAPLPLTAVILNSLQ